MILTKRFKLNHQNRTYFLMFHDVVETAIKALKLALIKYQQNLFKLEENS